MCVWDDQNLFDFPASVGIENVFCFWDYTEFSKIMSYPRWTFCCGPFVLLYSDGETVLNEFSRGSTGRNINIEYEVCVSFSVRQKFIIVIIVIRIVSRRAFMNALAFFRPYRKRHVCARRTDRNKCRETRCARRVRKATRKTGSCTRPTRRTRVVIFVLPRTCKISAV